MERLAEFPIPTVTHAYLGQNDDRRMNELCGVLFARGFKFVDAEERLTPRTFTGVYATRDGCERTIVLWRPCVELMESQ